jgi:hypothetical protein
VCFAVVEDGSFWIPKCSISLLDAVVRRITPIWNGSMILVSYS